MTDPSEFPCALDENNEISVWLRDEGELELFVKNWFKTFYGAIPTLPLQILTLEGPLGAGKTAFARSFLGEAGWKGPVRSPTYNLLNSYKLPAGDIVHADLYRLEGRPLDLLAEEFGTALVLVEWPDEFTKAAQDEFGGWKISIDVPSEGREFHLRQVFPKNG